MCEYNIQFGISSSQHAKHYIMHMQCIACDDRYDPTGSRACTSQSYTTFMVRADGRDSEL